MRLVRQSKAFQHARTLSRDDPARKERFREARTQHGFSEYALHAYAQQFGHAWLGGHLDSLPIQSLATRAYRAANRLLVGKAPPDPARGVGTSWTRSKARRRPAVPAGAGTGWNGRIWSWRRSSIRVTWCRSTGSPARSSTSDWSAASWGAEPLLRPAGAPGHAVPEAALPAGKRDRGAGPGTERSRGRLRAGRTPAGVLSRGGSRYTALRRIDRKLDRQRRANNPANYDERGRVKRGKQRWKASKRQRKVQARRREVYRKLAATRTRSHGRLAHRVHSLGSTF